MQKNCKTTYFCEVNMFILNKNIKFVWKFLNSKMIAQPS